MTDTNSTDDGSSGTPAGTSAGTQAAEGFVPVADLEREQARARDFQARADRTEAELKALRQANASAGKPEADDDVSKGLDPSARRTLMADVASVVQLAQSVATLKEKFPLADKAIFDRLDEYGNVDALYLVAEASHARVAALVEAEKTRIEAALRAEFGEKHGGAAPPADGNSSAPAGDPSVAQLQKMSMTELRAFEAANPGVADRVLRSAQ